MNLFKKTMIGAALAMGIAASAQATPINVGGVVWDPDNGIDFSAASVSIHQFIDSITGILSGFGTINSINGSSTFCAAGGCELTFQFGGFTPITGLLPSATGSTIQYAGGFVNVFADSTPEAANLDGTTMTQASTGDGALWLALTGHNLPTGSLVGTVSVDPVTQEVSTLVGSGLLDATGGLALEHFNTNTKADGSDMTFTNGFTTLLGPVTENPNTQLLESLGTGNFKGNSIPEPGSLALLGVGLFGLGTLRNRRKPQA
ncbi:MAG: sorting protein [Proteobacteria bacterium]|nr:sorting protein [Pseudomonadota bacterium]